MTETYGTQGELSLQDPWVLLFVLLVPLALLVRRRHGQPAILFAPLALFGTGQGESLGRVPRGGWRARAAGLPVLCEALGLLLALVALARPVAREALPHVEEGLEILLALDVSSSMAARDLDPGRTRLAIAKEAAAEFVAARPRDRIGLVVFARYPDLVAPPTSDHAALAEFLGRVERVEPEGPEDATGIGAALARAVLVLGEGQASEGGEPVGRVVILLTDGEENVAGPHSPREITPLAAARLAALAGVRVHAIAVGIGEPDGRGGWSPLDTRDLEGIARLGGGRFFAVRDAGAMAEVYARIDELETRELPDPRFRTLERFEPFLLAGLLLWLAGALLGRAGLEALP